MVVDIAPIVKSQMRRVRAMHFIGIGGVGMGGIAEVMHHLGFRVSGSDLGSNALTQRLQGLGIVVRQGHAAEHVEDADVVVISTAVPEDNPELVKARELRIPVVRRAEMLAELMRFQQGIAVAGTHGKTTTTSLVASLLTEGGMDPTYVIGGRLNSSSANAYLGQSEWLVAEADESDASFLYLQPVMSIVTNIDADHLSTYGGDFEKLKQTFVDFLMHLPFYGLAIVCIDDEHIRDVLPRVGRPVRTYGFDDSADVQATNVRQEGLRMYFDVRIDDGGDVSSEIRDIALNMPGRHNVLNALAAITVALELGVSVKASKRALSRFAGVGRRAQSHGLLHFKAGSAELIDDYGHHPTEVSATLKAIRGGWPERRMVVIFQPHRYTRTRDLFEDFAEALSLTDVLILSEVYAAGEEHINGADGRALARAIRNRGAVEPIFVENINDAPEALHRIIQDGDIVLTLGAGSVGGLALSLPEFFTAKSESKSATGIPIVADSTYVTVDIQPERFGKVAVVMGGWSAEREVSLMSGQQIFDSLTSSGVDAHAVDAGRDIAAVLSDGGFDRAFLILHGRGGEDGTVQGALELAGIPYTGSGVLASALCMDKWRAKGLVSLRGIATPEAVEVFSLEEAEQAASQIGFPVVIKPTIEGSSIGVTMVNYSQQLPSAFQEARRYGPVLVEKRMLGVEVTAGILGQTVLPLVSMKGSDEFYDYRAKYLADDTVYQCPVELPASTLALIQETALNAFNALGCRGWGRVDFMLDEAGNAQFIECNTAPGMTSHSLVPIAAREAGMDFSTLCLQILADTLCMEDLVA